MFLLILQLLILGILGWAAYHYIRLRQQVQHIIQQVQHIIHKMDCDELIDQLLQDNKHPLRGEAETVAAPHPECTTREPTTSVLPEWPEKKRERLVALAAGGHAQQYLGKQLSSEQIDKMADSDIEKLYARYEVYLGSSITKV